MDVLDELDHFRGDSATSLVTLTLPAGSSVSDARAFVKNEMSSARNIKSSKNRKSVMAALRSLSSTLGDAKKMPVTGLALYSGSCI